MELSFSAVRRKRKSASCVSNGEVTRVTFYRSVGPEELGEHGRPVLTR
jgi:hypothetical protein